MISNFVYLHYMKTAIIKLKFVQIENNINAISCNVQKSQRTEKDI